jgi:hypothetical protein
VIDLEILKDHGLTPELLEKKFKLEIIERGVNTEGKPVRELSGDEKIQKLRNRIRHRLQSGRNQNLSQYRLYHALDLAWDTPFRQITPTLLQQFLDKKPDDKEVLSTLSAWGFNPDDLIGEADDPKSPGKKIKQFNIPTFFNVFVPLVRAYVTIRLAKIMNDRLQIPMLKFDPAINSAKNRLQCDIITNRIELMNRQYNYWAVIKQSVFQMLHYSICLKFPMEEWHKEEQLIRDYEKVEEAETRSEDGLNKMLDGGMMGAQVPENVPLTEATEDGQAPEQEQKPAAPVGEAAVEAALDDAQDPEPAERKIRTRTKVVKEGLRYHMPHPSRMFWDQAHRVSTFNTDTGCEYAGYWRVMRYKDIRDNEAFWNTDKVSIGDTSWWTAAGPFWNSIFSGCTIKPPSTITASLEASSKDRETKMVYDFYTSDYDDASVVITEYFEKLIPKDYGLGDYEYPVWFRFVVAGDDTVIYCAPLPYVPVVAYIYDADELRSQNASLTLEILPFQDQVSNLLTQFILTAKANLSNVTFVDEDVVGKDWVATIRNWGEKLFRVRNFIPFSGRKAMKSQQGIPSAFFSHHFPSMDNTGILQAIKVVLDMLERVLVMSSQEVAQAASHELREKEVVNIQSSTSTRLTYTATNVDHAREAFKNQLYCGLMAYGEEDVYAEIANDPLITPAMLEKLGFTYVDDEDGLHVWARKKIQVKLKKTAIAYASFTTQRDGNDRPNDKDAVMQLANAMNGWLSNPILGPAIGPDQAIQLVNQIARMAGFPKEFKLENSTGNAALTAELKKFMDEIEQKIVGDIQKGLKPMMDLDLKQQQDIEQIKQMLGVPTAPPQPQQYDTAPGNPPLPQGNQVSPGATAALGVQ